MGADRKPKHDLIHQVQVQIQILYVLVWEQIKLDPLQCEIENFTNKVNILRSKTLFELTVLLKVFTTFE